jgi:flagellar biogenesis protein FliO
MNESAIIETFITLAGAVAVLGLILFFIKKYTAKSRDESNAVELKILAKMPLPPKNNLYVIKAAGKTLLIGASEKSISTLSELDSDGKNIHSTTKSIKKPEKLIEQSEEDALTFSSFLKSTLKKTN